MAEILEEAGGRNPLTFEELEQLVPFAVEDRYPVPSAPRPSRAEAIALLPIADSAVAELANATSSSY